tara:strand:+ start:92 stop:499 length:408 start_codon:yes stop_codon:yes gene_type:complete
MKKYQMFLGCFAVLVTVATVVGCSGGSKSLGSSVTGTITVNGSPAPAGLEISFQPSGDGSPSFGSTNSEGQYELQRTPRSKGATPGENIVTVTFPINEDEEAPADLKILKTFTDGSYKVTVSKGQNTIDLEIAAE